MTDATVKRSTSLQHGLRGLATAVVCAFGTAVCLPAQAPAQGDPGVRELLALFDREIRETHVTRAGRVYSIRLLTGQAASPAARDSLLDGLERLAVASDHPQVAFFAAEVMVEAGSREQLRPLAGIVPRLERIYRGTGSGYVRRGIRGRAYLLADRPSAARLLASIAVGAGSADAGQVDFGGVDSPRLEALRELAVMGTAGRDALMDLHRRDAVRDPLARDFLRQLANRGFPVTDRPAVPRLAPR
jgi:hypothetical protein